jgi:thiol:disulfide interchange protein
MRRAHPRWLAAVSLPILVALLAGLLLVPASSAFADPAKPKKKDTNPRLKSRYATLTASVEPSEAKPGETVTFKVTAKLDPGYHIYKYTEKPLPPGSGPVYTTFDFFDTAGLKVEGDWQVSKEPIKHKEPVWPDLPFVEYYEDEVTWSVKLKVPEGTEPGKKTLRCQLGYMICNEKSCSAPGQWTLPDAELTVLPAGAPVKKATPDPKPTAATPAPAPAPATPSSPRTDPAESSGAAESRTVSTPPAAPAGSAPKIKSEVALKAEQGILPFLIFSAIGGLFALVMPCVWPMVPITVNFFVKQGQGKSGRGKTTGLAITYCLSIIGVFTAVGVLVSFFFSAGALQNLANTWWLNLIVAALFVLFGLSLLGLFEIRLPSFFLNASAQGESRGGLIGVFFMALTLTITSFTCTFPVVGGLLVMAANGDFFYPIIGLATFATVLAFPFFLLALSPSLISKMPRSGDWMNAVKVVGGLIEIGAALKFINTAELAFVTPEDAWFNAPVVLTSWIALSLVCGLYLLGLFRTDHDHDEVKVGPGRLVFGVVFLGLALFLTPALFGRAPQSQIWNRLIVGLLPPDSSVFNASNQGAGASGEVKATSRDPAQAEREQKSFHGVVWGMSYDQAREQAAAEKRPILIDFTGVNCANCRQMESGVFPRREIVELLKKFVTVQLYTDFVPIDSITADEREARAVINQDRLLDLNERTNPLYVILSPSGEVIDRIGGYNEPKVFAEFLQRALEKFADVDKVTPSAGEAEILALTEVKATSSDPAQAEREEKKAHGVLWGLSYDQARELAASEQKPILIDFSRQNCPGCWRMQRFVHPRPEVAALLRKFVTLQLYLDAVPATSLPGEQRARLAKINLDRLKSLDPNASNPFYIVLSPSGEVLEKISGFREPPVFTEFLRKALAKFPETAKVAQASESAKPTRRSPEAGQR